MPACARAQPVRIVGARLDERRQGLTLRSPELRKLVVNLVTEQRPYETLHPGHKQRVIPDVCMSLANRNQRRPQGALAALRQNDSSALAEKRGDAAEQCESEPA